MDVFKLTTCGALASLLFSAHAAAHDLASSAAIDFQTNPAAEATTLNLAMQVDAPDAVDTYAPSTTPTFGMADTWRFNILAGGGFALDDDKDTALVFGGVGLSYFIIDNFSLELEFNLMGFDQPGKDAFGGNFNLLIRWHIIAQETWSIYIDGGAGMLGTTANVPPGTISFNFTPQIGLGATLEVAHDVRAFVGVRLHHISNANIGDQNFGLDNAIAYAGVSFPF